MQRFLWPLVLRRTYRIWAFVTVENVRKELGSAPADWSGCEEAACPAFSSPPSSSSGCDVSARCSRRGTTTCRCLAMLVRGESGAVALQAASPAASARRPASSRLPALSPRCGSVRCATAPAGAVDVDTKRPGTSTSTCPSARRSSRPACSAGSTSPRTSVASTASSPASRPTADTRDGQDRPRALRLGAHQGRLRPRRLLRRAAPRAREARRLVAGGLLPADPRRHALPGHPARADDRGDSRRLGRADDARDDQRPALDPRGARPGAELARSSSWPDEGWSAGQIARKLRIPKEKVRRVLKGRTVTILSCGHVVPGRGVLIWCPECECRRHRRGHQNGERLSPPLKRSRRMGTQIALPGALLQRDLHRLRARLGLGGQADRAERGCPCPQPACEQ